MKGERCRGGGRCRRGEYRGGECRCIGLMSFQSGDFCVGAVGMVVCKGVLERHFTHFGGLVFVVSALLLMRRG